MWTKKFTIVSRAQCPKTFFGNILRLFLLVVSGRSLDLFVKASPDGTTGAELSSSLHTFEKGIMTQNSMNHTSFYSNTIHFHQSTPSEFPFTFEQESYFYSNLAPRMKDFVADNSSPENELLGWVTKMSWWILRSRGDVLGGVYYVQSIHSVAKLHYIHRLHGPHS